MGPARCSTAPALAIRWEWRSPADGKVYVRWARMRTHGGKQTAAQRQAQALAGLTVQQAGERLVLDWTEPLRHTKLVQGCVPASSAAG